MYILCFQEMIRMAAKEDAQRRTKGRTGWPQAVWASELETKHTPSSCGNSSSGEHELDT